MWIIIYMYYNWPPPLRSLRQCFNGDSVYCNNILASANIILTFILLYRQENDAPCNCLYGCGIYHKDYNTRDSAVCITLFSAFPSPYFLPDFEVLQKDNKNRTNIIVPVIYTMQTLHIHHLRICHEGFTK